MADVIDNPQEPTVEPTEPTVAEPEKVEPPVTEPEPVAEPEKEPAVEPEPVPEEPGAEPEPQDDPVVEPEKVETPEPEVKDSEELADAKAELTKTTNKLKAKEKEIESLKGANKAMEEALADVLKQKLESFPKDMAKLMPEDNVVAQLSWLAKAEDLGISVNKEIGKPVPADNTKTANMATKNKSLNATQRMSTIFAERFGK